MPLDPNPLNELGKGILDPTVEAKLIERGIVFAQTITRPDGATYLRTARRPITQCYADAITSLMRVRENGVTVPAAPVLAAVEQSLSAEEAIPAGSLRFAVKAAPSGNSRLQSGRSAPFSRTITSAPFDQTQPSLPSLAIYFAPDAASAGVKDSQTGPWRRRAPWASASRVNSCAPPPR